MRTANTTQRVTQLIFALGPFGPTLGVSGRGRATVAPTWMPTRKARPRSAARRGYVPAGCLDHFHDLPSRTALEPYVPPTRPRWRGFLTRMRTRPCGPSVEHSPRSPPALETTQATRADTLGRSSTFGLRL